MLGRRSLGILCLMEFEDGKEGSAGFLIVRVEVRTYFQGRVEVLQKMKTLYVFRRNGEVPLFG